MRQPNGLFRMERIPGARVSAAEVIVADAAARFPPTRFQGSKRKLAARIGGVLAGLEFETALDAFGGTGCIAYVLKALGKRVTFNDALRANAEMATALLENDAVQLDARTVDRLLAPGDHGAYPTFIADTFVGIYFTNAENAWLDRACTRIARMRDRHKRALAWYSLFQAAIVKRPYNLFHRRNLYMRTADVPRSFGNKRTWDTPFADHFRTFAERANRAVRRGPGRCRVRCGDACDVPGPFDLVYIDPPYVSARGVGVDYHHFYHFLEGMLDYSQWGQRIDWHSKHRRLHAQRSCWTDSHTVGKAFAALFARHAESVLAVSYRSDGIPAVDELIGMLRRHKRRVEVHEQPRYQYALSSNRKSTEVLLVAR